MVTQQDISAYDQGLHELWDTSNNGEWINNVLFDGFLNFQATYVEPWDLLVVCTIAGDGTRAGGLFGFSSINGTLLWGTELGTLTLYGNVLVNQKLYVSSTGNVYSIDPIGGATLVYTIVNMGTSFILCSDNYLVSWNSAVAIYKIATDGYQPISSITLVPITAMCYNNTAFYVTADEIAAVDLYGSFLWRVPYTTLNSPIIYHNPSMNSFWLLDPTTPTDGSVYVSTMISQVTQVNMQTGNTMSQYTVDVAPFQTTVKVNPFLSKNNMLYGIGMNSDQITLLNVYDMNQNGKLMYTINQPVTNLALGSQEDQPDNLYLFTEGNESNIF